MKTRTELITRALRRLRVVAMDEAATAEQEQVADEALTALIEELQAGHSVFVPGSVEFDEEYYLPLAYLLAAEIAPDMAVQSPEPRSRAMTRLKAVLNTFDKEEPTKAVYY